MRRRRAVSAALLLAASCDRGGAATPPFGAACGVKDLRFHVAAGPPRALWIDEVRVSGVLESDPPRAVPISMRQQQVEAALPCLESEAGQRGLAVEYPTLEIN